MKAPEKFNTLKEFVESEEYTQWVEEHSTDEIHKCYTCPLIQEEIEERILVWSVGQCYYHRYEDFIEDLREICGYCWCDKCEGKI